MNKTTVEICGMTCRSCEMLIEDELLKLPNVTHVKVSQKKGNAVISYSGELNEDDVEAAVKEAGYSLGKDRRSLFSKNPTDYLQVFIITGWLFMIWFIGGALGLFNFKLPEFNNYASLPIVFLIGLTAGISTCMALIGGLVLGASARFAEKHPTATMLQKFKPHLFFNLGRVISFLLFGAIIGYIGSFFRFSPSVLGIMIIVVGLVMFLVGVQLTNLSPRLNAFKLTLPKQLGSLLGIKTQKEKEYSNKNAALLGASTFFLPCGFTQAMQLYAMSTGNPVDGALTMGVFALGTAPGLLGIGGLTAMVRGSFAQWFFKFAGVIVILLALYNIQSGVTLAGIKSLALPSITTSADSNTQPSTGEVQVLTSTYTTYEMIQPSTFTVKAGTPARLEVTAKDNGTGCMGSITIPGLTDKVEVFKKGETLTFDFTADRPGEYDITCAMGIPMGRITAI